MMEARNKDYKMHPTKTIRFLMIAFGWTSLVGLALHFGHISVHSLTGLIIIGLLYMPAPAIAALLVEGGVVRQRLLLPLQASRRQRLLFFLLAPLIALSFVGLLIGATLALGNGAHIKGVGSLLTNVHDFREALVPLVGPAKAQQAHLPGSILLLYIVTVVAASVAGWSINGLLAMGEEYGWRGFLWERFQRYGTVKSNLIIGVLWGLWHAPLIVLGYNYPGQPLAGVMAMIGLTVPLTFVLTAVRRLTNSVLPCAATHGAINGIASFMSLVVVGNSLLGGMLGLVGDACFVVIAAVLWWQVRRTDAALCYHAAAA